MLLLLLLLLDVRANTYSPIPQTYPNEIFIPTHRTLKQTCVFSRPQRASRRCVPAQHYSRVSRRAFDTNTAKTHTLHPSTIYTSTINIYYVLYTVLVHSFGTCAKARARAFALHSSRVAWLSACTITYTFQNHSALHSAI